MKKVSIQLIDDLDGDPIPEGSGRSITFTLEDRRYELDLRDENIERLREALAPFIDAAQSFSRTRAGGGSRITGFDDLQTIRDWAAANGYNVRGRGRIAAEVLRAYADAHGE